jgi:PKD repeat protein
MRKFYFLLACCFTSFILKAQTTNIVDFNFSADPLTNNVVFTNTSVLPGDGIKKAFWYFGDGSLAITPPLAGVNHHYSSSGSYQACLKIFKYNNNNGTDSVLLGSVCKSVTIQQHCTAGFQWVDSVGPNTLPHSVSFFGFGNHNANKRILEVCWNFGDGTDTCIQATAGTAPPLNIRHKYNHNGTYNVCVRIKYDGGCVAEKCNTITLGSSNIPDSCRANFTVAPVNSVASLARKFIAQPWHNKNKKPVRICWDFGDGKDTCIQYTTSYTGDYFVEHSYLQPGQYNVCVKIKYDGGCEASKCNSIAVPPVSVPDSCKADFGVSPNTIAFSLARKFIARPWHNNNKKPVRICWTFGDGKDTCIQYTTAYNGDYFVEHRYLQPGRYNVCVKIKYDGGCEASKCDSIGIPPLPVPDSCRANFTIQQPITAVPTLARKFIAQPWHNNNKRPVRICWTFGDGKDTCIQYTTSYTGVYFVEHRYLQPGRYNVCVKIKYDGGCEASKCDSIGIPPITIPDSCSANFTMQPVTATPLARKFIAQPWHNNNKKPVRICWSFGDGRDTCIQYPANYTGDYFVEHRYAQPGQYEVCVLIKYEGGCEKRKCNIVSVPPVPDTCSFDLSEVAVSTSSLERKFYVGLMQNRRAEKICWSFGDGTDTCVILSNPINPQQLIISHRYAAPGTYTVCAKVSYVGGCVVQKCKTITIASTHPNVCGGYMIDSVVSANTIRFKGTGIHTPNDFVTSYRWTFGDGTAGTGQVVNHTYAAAGRYNVCLFMTTNSGCETKICKTVGVAGNNQPQLLLTPNPVVNVLNATFISLFQQTLSVRIYNANGLMVRSYVRNANVGVNAWTFTDVATLPIGVYSVIVQSSNQFATAIFFKQ